MNSMLKLKNIKKSNGFIEANYIPIDTEEEGYIKLDKDFKITESVTTSKDEILPTYLSHARWKLKEIYGKEEIPEELIVAWY